MFFQPLVDSLTPDRNPLDPMLREMEAIKDLAMKVKDKVRRDVAGESYFHRVMTSIFQ